MRIYTLKSALTVVSQSGVIEQGAPLLKLDNLNDYNEHILVRAAKHCEENDRTPEAIKLYNLAGDYTTVIACLAQALGNSITQHKREVTLSFTGTTTAGCCMPCTPSPLR